MLRFEEVADLLRIIDSSSCEELILDTADLKLVVRRHRAASAIPNALPSPNHTLPAQTSPLPQPPPASTPPAASRAKSSVAGFIEIKAPMVGTFYVAPSPGAAPFAEIGSVVAEGDKLCMIEVMKLFTTIFAEQGGRIVQICAHDGDLVEYGQTLFLQEPI